MLLFVTLHRLLLMIVELITWFTRNALIVTLISRVLVSVTVTFARGLPYTIGVSVISTQGFLSLPICNLQTRLLLLLLLLVSIW